MATTQRPRLKSHHHFLLGAIIALLLLLLLWLAAVHWHWGPYRTKVTVPATSTSTEQGAATGSGGSAASSTGATGATGATGSSGSNGGNTTTTGTPIFNLYGAVANGDTKAEVNGMSAGLSPNCTTVTSNPGGKQEVCTYTEGNQVVTVTYLNDRVIGVSKSGF